MSEGTDVSETSSNATRDLNEGTDLKRKYDYIYGCDPLKWFLRKLGLRDD